MGERGEPKAVPQLCTEGVRSCLRCNKEFKSKGPHNRICVNCRATPTRGCRLVQQIKSARGGGRGTM